MISNLTIRIISILALVLAVLAGTYSGYSHIKHIGYLEAEAKYTLIIKDYEDNINKKIGTLEVLSNTLVNEQRENSLVLAQDIDKIIKGQKGKTLTIIKNGECLPSQTFSDSFVTINKRVNESIKDKKQ